jgi:hypothetical protein
MRQQRLTRRALLVPIALSRTVPGWPDRAPRPAESRCLRFAMLFLHEFDAAVSCISFETGRLIFLDVTKKIGL